LEYRLEIAEICAFIERVGTPPACNFPFIIPQMPDTTVVVELRSNASLVAYEKWRHCGKKSHALGETTRGRTV
jgi:hypothetical protein